MSILPLNQEVAAGMSWKDMRCAMSNSTSESVKGSYDADLEIVEGAVDADLWIASR